MALLSNLIKLEYGRVAYSIIGDSISDGSTEWPAIVAASYNGGLCTVLNNAVGGETVVTHMDAQSELCEIDHADFTLILLGRNDTDPAPTFQAVYQANLIELYAACSKPIYAMGILNASDDATGWRATKNGYISSAVTAAAATGVDVTYWNTDDWIVPATDTDDGTHPNAAGHAKIAAEVLALLPAWATPAQKYLQSETSGIEVFA